MPWSRIPNSENSFRLHHASTDAAITGDRHQMPYRTTHSQPTSPGQISVLSIRQRLGLQRDLCICVVDTTIHLCTRMLSSYYFSFIHFPHIKTQLYADPIKVDLLKYSPLSRAGHPAVWRCFVSSTCWDILTHERGEIVVVKWQMTAVR